jgi:tetratricopeptide (TPR) repeat protein
MSARNLIFCLAGLVLGFSVGFALANRIVPASAGRALAADSAAAPADQSAPAAPGSAGPLAPDQAGGPLPAGHPDISGINSDGSPADPNGVAARDVDAQKAMEAADAKPSDFKAQMDAAETFYRLKAYDKASLYLDRALKLKPREAAALALAGNAKYDAGDFTAAASFYERALAVEPSNADVRNDLGNTYSKRQPADLRRAVEEYRKAVEANPRHEVALQNMATVAVQLGDKSAAREAVDKLAQLNPSNPTLSALRSAVEAIP